MRDLAHEEPTRTLTPTPYTLNLTLIPASPPPFALTLTLTFIPHDELQSALLLRHNVTTLWEHGCCMDGWLSRQNIAKNVEFIQQTYIHKPYTDPCVALRHLDHHPRRTDHRALQSFSRKMHTRSIY